MPTFHGQTVDVAEGFEGSFPESPWAESDASSKLSQSATAKYAGTYGMLYDYTGAAEASINYDTGSNRSAVSFGLWMYMPTYTNYGGLGIVVSGQDAATNQNVRLHVGKHAGTSTYQVQVRNNAGTFSDPVTVSQSTWYWITFKLVSDGNITLRVYDTTGTLVGSEVSVATGTASVRTWHVGAYYAFAATSNAYWDDIVIDYTAAAFPLLGWAAAGLSIPVAMHHYRKLRS